MHIATPQSSGFAAYRIQPRTEPHDAYLYLLCLALAGYALLGKGFAYVGYPPLLIGEVTLVLGLMVLFRSRCGIATLASLPSVCLVALLALVVARTISCFGDYGLDAIRDSVIVVYGLFAFIVMALLLEEPNRLAWSLSAYSRLAWLYGLVGGTLTYITTGFAYLLPIWPLSGVSIVYVRLGEAAVHLAGAAIFALLSLRKVTKAWTLVLVVGIGMITPSRGAMLACVISIALAVLLGRQLRRFMPALLAAGAFLLLSYVTGLEIPIPGAGDRSFGASQIVSNVESIFGSSQAGNLDGTKTWRLRWWQAINDYTFNGPYFWTGKGYGLGLAEADGFVVGLEMGGPVLRSPHNAHVTILARSGVPGLVLWLVTCAVWFAMMFRSMLLARSRGDEQWANVFIWNGCYALAIVINSSFDVALEGPMLGIWFWSLFGLGIASSMIYRWDVARGTSRQLLQV